MYQAAAEVWNQIAEEQPLQTAWAQQMFPLPAEQMARALEAEETRLAKTLGSALLGSIYLQMMPLLWERIAILGFLTDHPGLMGAILPIESPSEAVLMASRDYPLTPTQQQQLLKHLCERPTLPLKFSSGAKMLTRGDYAVAAVRLKKLMDQNPEAATPKQRVALAYAKKMATGTMFPRRKVLDFDPEKYAKALPSFRSAMREFSGGVNDNSAVAKALVDYLIKGGLTREGYLRLKPYLVRYMEDLESGKQTLDVLGRSGSPVPSRTDKIGFVDEPSDFDSPEIWRKFLAQVEAYPEDEVQKERLLKIARRGVAFSEKHYSANQKLKGR